MFGTNHGFLSAVTIATTIHCWLTIVIDVRPSTAVTTSSSIWPGSTIFTSTTVTIAHARLIGLSASTRTVLRIFTRRVAGDLRVQKGHDDRTRTTFANPTTFVAIRICERTMIDAVGKRLTAEVAETNQINLGRITRSRRETCVTLVAMLSSLHRFSGIENDKKLPGGKCLEDAKLHGSQVVMYKRRTARRLAKANRNKLNG